MNHFRTGLPSFDGAVYHGAIPDETPSVALRGRGGLVHVRPLPGVPEVRASGMPDHLLICCLGATRMAADPMPDVARRVLERDTLINHPRGIDSRWLSEAGQPEVLQFHFTDRALGEVAEDVGLKGLALGERPAIGLRHPLLTSLAREARRELLRGEGASVLALESLYLRGLVTAVRAFGSSRARGAAASNALTPARMKRLRDHVESRLAENIGLADMAEVVGVSRPHLARIFRETTGTSAYRWVLELRIERAKDLLASTDLPIADVALTCGFGSQSHFSHVFHANVGATPRRFRLAARG